MGHHHVVRRGGLEVDIVDAYGVLGHHLQGRARRKDALGHRVGQDREQDVGLVRQGDQLVLGPRGALGGLADGDGMLLVQLGEPVFDERTSDDDVRHVVRLGVEKTIRANGRRRSYKAAYNSANRCVWVYGRVGVWEQ